MWQFGGDKEKEVLYMDETPLIGPLFEIEECIGVGISGMDSHFHNDKYEIYYLVKGEIDYFISEKNYNVYEGDIVIIPPNTLHKTIPKNDQIRKRILLFINDSYLKGFDSRDVSLWREVSILHSNKDDRIGVIFQELLEEYKNKRNTALLKALTCELVILLQREKEKKDKAIKDSAPSKLISEIIAYINSNYHNKVTLEETAKLFFTNPSYLSRIFKDCTGISFSDFLTNFRIKKALELLLETEQNITQIAFDVGFNSTNHFCKVFKTVMKTSPLQYKKQQQKSLYTKNSKKIKKSIHI